MWDTKSWSGGTHESRCSWTGLQPFANRRAISRDAPTDRMPVGGQ